MVGCAVFVSLGIDIAHGSGSDSLCGGEASYGTLLSWVLVTVVQVVVGKRFYRNAYKVCMHDSIVCVAPPP